MFLVFEQLQPEYDQWVMETRLKIEEGIESLEKGEGVDSDIVIARLRSKLHRARENQK